MQKSSSIRLHALSTLACIVFSSCLGLNANIVLEEDLSGKISFTYSVSTMALSSDRLPEKGKYLPLPVDSEGYERLLARIPDMETLFFSRQEGKEDVVITASYSFGTINSLISFLNYSGNKVSFKTSEGRRKLNFDFSVNQEKTDPELEALMNGVFKKYSIVCTVVSALPFDSASPGTLSQDRKTASVAVSLPEIVKSKTPVQWGLEWGEGTSQKQ